MEGLLNQSINLYVVFRDASGEPVSGLSDVTVTVYGPDNAADVSAGACTEIGSTGRYYRAFTPDQKGSFLAIFATAGSAVYNPDLSVSFYIADPADLKATGFSTFDASADTVNVGKIAGTSVSGPDDLKATGFSTFNPASDQVTVSTNNDKTGYALANPDLCKADVAGLSVFDPTIDTVTVENTAACQADVSSLALDSTLQAVKTLTDKLSAMLENPGTYDRWKATALEQAPDSVADVSGLSTFDPVADTVIVGTNNDKEGYSLTNPDLYKADIAGLSTFNPATDEVDIGKVKGIAVTDVTDFHATIDLTGLSTFDHTTDTVIVGNTADCKADVSGLSTFNPSTQTVNVGHIAGTEVSGPDDLKAVVDLSGIALSSDLVYVRGIADKLDSAMVLDGGVYQFTINALENAPTGSGDANVNVVSVNDIAVSGPDDFKATGFSTFNPATDTVDIGKVAGSAVSGIADFRASVDLSNLDVPVSSRLASADYTAPSDIDLSGLSTFDPATDEVNVGKVKGSAVTDITDFHADIDLSGISTFNPSEDTVNVGHIAGNAVTGPDDFKAVVDLSGIALSSDLVYVRGIADKLDSAMIPDGDEYQFSVNALENAPSGGGDSNVNVVSVGGNVVTSADDFKADLTTVLSNLNSLLTRLSEVRISKLDVAGDLANTDNADSFKADSLTVDLSGLATETNLDLVRAVTDKLNGLIENVSGNRFTAKALEAAPVGAGGSVDLSGIEADLDTLLATNTEARLSKLDTAGALANTENADLFKASVVDISSIEADLDTLLATNTEARLAKLDIAGTLANTENADLFKADAVDLTGVAKESTSQYIKAKVDLLPEYPADEVNALTNKNEILLAISGITDGSAPGVGAYPLTVTTEQANGTPIASVRVEIWNSAASLRIASLLTNSLGQATFVLDEGEYIARAILVGWEFVTSDTVLITAPSAALQITGSLLSIGAPSDSSLCRVSTFCFDEAGQNPRPSVRSVVYLIKDPVFHEGKLLKNTPRQPNYDPVSGAWWVDIPRGTWARVTIKETGFDHEVSIPNQASAILETLI